MAAVGGVVKTHQHTDPLMIAAGVRIDVREQLLQLGERCRRPARSDRRRALVDPASRPVFEPPRGLDHLTAGRSPLVVPFHPLPLRPGARRRSQDVALVLDVDEGTNLPRVDRAGPGPEVEMSPATRRDHLGRGRLAQGLIGEPALPGNRIVDINDHQPARCAGNRDLRIIEVL